MNTRTRLAPEDRKRQIVAAAVRLAAKKGFAGVTREAIADAAHVSVGLVSHYCGGMDGLRKAVVDEAIRTQNVKLLGQALLVQDPAARRAPPDLRRQAIASLLK